MSTNKQLNCQEAKVWELHMGGMAVSEIVAETHLDESFIRSAITGVWREDGQVLKNAA